MSKAKSTKKNIINNANETDQFEKLIKIKLVENEKTPINKWKDPRNQFYSINNNMYNIGVLTGKINNIFVLDVDIKKEGKNELDGMAKINEYIREHGDIKTLTIKSPSGGIHYYFKYEGEEDIKYIMKNHLYTRQGIGNYSIDIRSDNGYIVAPPSSINGKPYQVINNTTIASIPKELAYFIKTLEDNKDEEKMNKMNLKIKTIIEKKTLTEEDEEEDAITSDESKESERDDRSTKNKHYQDNFTYVMDDAKINELLNMLPSGYDNEFFNYMTITTILKNHNKVDIWNNWSKKNATKYNYYKNWKLWRWCKPIYNINLLVYILRTKFKKNVEYIHYYKNYKPITFNNFYNEMKEVNEQYISNAQVYEDFLNHDVHIIKSTTGTGKTTATALNMEQYMKDNKNIKFISITSRTSLSDQHVETFKNINLSTYQAGGNLYTKRAVTICINSLERIACMEDEEIKNYVLYIDEISSFLEFTHNETLKDNMKHIYKALINFIKHCNKVIVSDAMVNDNVINFLKSRKHNNIHYLLTTPIKNMKIK